MEVSVTNLAVRNGKFVFRYRLPSIFLPEKNREIRISLRTKDLKKALICCKLASEKMKTLIETGDFMSIPLQDTRFLKIFAAHRGYTCYSSEVLPFDHSGMGKCKTHIDRN